MLPLPFSRRAWIEICHCLEPSARRLVALLAEGVDRNLENVSPMARFMVALLTEGVDRNIDINREFTAAARSPSSRRAWIEISGWGSSLPAAWSSSSRRAWIEILYTGIWAKTAPVALLTEGVDRNTSEVWPSSSVTVALLAEGVDRNNRCGMFRNPLRSRPSRGGRG